MEEFDESYTEINNFDISFRKFLDSYSKNTNVNLSFLLNVALPFCVDAMKKQAEEKTSASFSKKKGMENE